MKQTYKVNAELRLRPFISEMREVAQTLTNFANELEKIERKYSTYSTCNNDCKNCVNHGYCDYEV